ncbi:hypothetical protein G9272_17420 [Streptomyces asoensis]|uniref:Uncharacterized protein n=1 Tax=Streptomyces asoensis TaxID=249586 RepID=A0A6M4WN94_9ACTN|nr:hypothetical protein [Streptomyces asoensis]QJT01874.1 hypothetical protein G9272_17420 [Streptomyces asoensis]
MPTVPAPPTSAVHPIAVPMYGRTTPAEWLPSHRRGLVLADESAPQAGIPSAQGQESVMGAVLDDPAVG